MIPPFLDPEGCTVIINFTTYPSTTDISITGNEFIFSPRQVGTTDIELTLKDNKGLTNIKTFKMIAYGPPKFSEVLPKKIELMASTTIFY